MPVTPRKAPETGSCTAETTPSDWQLAIPHPSFFLSRWCRGGRIGKTAYDNQIGDGKEFDYLQRGVSTCDPQH